MKKKVLWALVIGCLVIDTAALAVSGSGIGALAANVTSNLLNIAKLITAASYVAGMAFVVGAVVKFKAHKDNPTQIPIGTPIALLFVGAALIFIPSVFGSLGSTVFGTKKIAGGITGSGFASGTGK